MRSVLSMTDIIRMLEIMPRVPRLQAGLLAGAGLRIESDMLTLRLKDIRLSDRVITIYEAKGNKSRAVRIPEFLVADLEGDQLQGVGAMVEVFAHGGPQISCRSSVVVRAAQRTSPQGMTVPVYG
jgi:integrase